MPSPVMKCDHRLIDDFTLESRAARALDTTLAIEKYQLAQRNILSGAQLIVEIEPAGVLPMTNRQILQRALAPLVTDWTIKWMARQ